MFERGRPFDRLTPASSLLLGTAALLPAFLAQVLVPPARPDLACLFAAALLAAALGAPWAAATARVTARPWLTHPPFSPFGVVGGNAALVSYAVELGEAEE